MEAAVPEPRRPGAGIAEIRRTPRPLASMPTHLAPSLLKYNPKFSSTLVTASTDGVFQHCDVGGLFAIAGLAQVGRFFGFVRADEAEE